MSIFDGLVSNGLVSNTNNVAEQRKPKFHYINIGIPVPMQNSEETGEANNEVFINLPVVISVDDIERQIKAINANSSENWKIIQNGKNLLAQAVIDLFKQLPQGNAVLQKDLPQDSLLRHMTIQFLHAAPREDVSAQVHNPFAGLFGNK